MIRATGQLGAARNNDKHDRAAQLLNPQQLELLTYNLHRIKWIYSSAWGGTRAHESTAQSGGGAQDHMTLQLSIGRGSPVPTTNWGALDSWKLLRKEESVFFKGMAPSRSTTLQWMGTQLRATQHNSWAAQTGLNELFFKMEDKRLVGREVGVELEGGWSKYIAVNSQRIKLCF